MTWWQFSLDCASAEIESVETILLEQGALCISLGDAGDEAIYEPPPGDNPLWQQTVVTATFDADADPEALWQRLQALLPPRLAAGLRRSGLEDQDWVQSYKRHFQPLQCAPGLWIVPSWCEPPEPEAVNIRLDPGLAFGTGSHPTTFMCLERLAALDPAGCDIIDYGCGSGILAIAACLLGAASARAVDIDVQALDACRANLAANGIDAARLRVESPETLERTPADILLANILAGPLIDLAPEFAALVTDGGQVLLSGILKSQQDSIQSAYRPYFELDRLSESDGWICLGGPRRARVDNGKEYASR